MKKIRPLLFFFLLTLICSCNSRQLKVNKQYRSGNPSEILDAKTYNRLQQQYETILYFQKGTAVVKNNKYGLIDEFGKEVLPCEYDTIYGNLKHFRVLKNNPYLV